MIYAHYHFNEKERKKMETLARKVPFEILSICTKCGERWGTLEEYKMVLRCDNCKTGKWMEYVVPLEDLKNWRF